MSHNIKLIVTDLDGTFLPDRDYFIEENLKAVAAAKEAGIRVCIATGRHWGSSKCVLDAAPFDALSITGHGAAVVESATGKYRYLNPVPGSCLPKLVRHLLNKESLEPVDRPRTHDVDLPKNGSSISLATQAFSAVYRPGLTTPMEEQYSYPYGPKYPMVRRAYRDVDSWTASVGENTEWVTFDIGRIGVEDIAELKQEISAFAPLEVTTAYGTVMEITAKGATKGEGIRWVAEHYGIQRDEILAIGDNLNDADMFRCAGVGVCVANGHEALKQMAHMIAPACNEAGFAKIVYDCIEGRI